MPRPRPIGRKVNLHTAAERMRERTVKRQRIEAPDDDSDANLEFQDIWESESYAGNFVGS